MGVSLSARVFFYEISNREMVFCVEEGENIQLKYRETNIVSSRMAQSIQIN